MIHAGGPASSDLANSCCPNSMGYEEVPHAADYEVRVWAPNFGMLITEAARALTALAGIRVDDSVRVRRAARIEGNDSESLLVGFLNELLFLQEHEMLAFDEFDLEASSALLSGWMLGSPIRRILRSIKAVTFNELRIESSSSGLEVRIVFDA